MESTCPEKSSNIAPFGYSGLYSRTFQNRHVDMSVNVGKGGLGQGRVNRERKDILPTNYRHIDIIYYILTPSHELYVDNHVDSMSINVSTYFGVLVN
jgi:hypothetical protein